MTETLTPAQPKKLFGTDGVRGRVNTPPMTVEMALALGRAMGVVLRRKEGRHRVVLGKDTRLSCYMLENALIAGLCSMGVDTYMLGPLPSPGVAYITRAYRADAGVVISASHNPFYDNGIKFFSSEGFKLDGTLEFEIEKVILGQAYNDKLPADHELGKNNKIVDGQGRYIEFAKASFPRHLSLGHFRIALDCAHGAAYRVAPLVFSELGAEVHSIGVSPDGQNINLNAGALHPEEVAALVREKSAHVGIALDGDGDRVIFSDEKGQVVDGDVILAICALDLHRRGVLEKDGVVGTEMTNLGIVHSLEKEGVAVHRSAVGDRHVFQKMVEEGVTIGGEQSGHLIFLEHTTTGDGIVSALQVLRVMCETGKPLSELAACVSKYPQKLINVTVSERPPLEELKSVQKAVAFAEKALGDKGRVVLRYSGTEPKCRVMVESKRESQVIELAQAIAEAVRKEIGA